MTFEKALEAMKQGKKVRRKIYSAYEYWFYNSDFDRVIVCDGENYRGFGVKPAHDIIESCKDDWEIYEEPKQEMQIETVIRLLQEIKTTTIKHEKEFENIFTYFDVSDATKAIDFAIETLENQNQPEPEKKSESDSEKWIERAVDNQRIEEEFKAALACIRDQPQKIKPEKECDCNCNSETENLQEEMKETLSSKFFELDRIEKDSLAVSTMLDIYRLLFEVQP